MGDHGLRVSRGLQPAKTTREREPERGVDTNPFLQYGERLASLSAPREAEQPQKMDVPTIWVVPRAIKPLAPVGGRFLLSLCRE